MTGPAGAAARPAATTRAARARRGADATATTTRPGPAPVTTTAPATARDRVQARSSGPGLTSRRAVTTIPRAPAARQGLRLLVRRLTVTPGCSGVSEPGEEGRRP